MSKFWRSYFNWYWWIIFQCGISRNMSSIGISKWQQELEMDFQLRSSTSLWYLLEDDDEERWAHEIFLHKGMLGTSKHKIQLMKIIIMVEIMRLRTKVYSSMNSCIAFVYLGPYMLVCACVCNILSRTMSLFLWRWLKNSRYLFDIFCGDGVS